MFYSHTKVTERIILFYVFTLSRIIVISALYFRIITPQKVKFCRCRIPVSVREKQ